MTLEQARWGVAGLTTEAGSLDRPAADATWLIPKVVEIEGDALRWEWGAHKDELAEVGPTPTLLERFVGLDRASPERIRDFARWFGVLHVCRHGQPLTPEGTQSALSVWYAGALDHETCDESVNPEPLEFWRRYAGWARQILNLAAALHADPGGLSTEVGWRRLGLEPPDDLESAVDLRSLATLRLEMAVNSWLALTGVRPHFTYGETAIVDLRGIGLLGSLAVRLTLAASRTEGLAMCSACGSPFIPSRRPAATRRRYCQRCRDDGAPRRDAARAHLRRRQAAKGA